MSDDYSNYLPTGLTEVESLAAQALIWEIESVADEDYREVLSDYLADRQLQIPDAVFEAVVEAMNRVSLTVTVNCFAPIDEVEL